MTETGLLGKWIKQWSNQSACPISLPKEREDRTSRRRLSIYNLTGVFVLYLAGIVLGFLTFIGERVTASNMKKQTTTS